MSTPAGSKTPRHDGRTASERLRVKLEPLMAEVSVRSAMMVEHPRPAEVYRALLELLYGEIRASIPLMGTVGARAAELAQLGDPVADAMLPWLRRHIEDETGHDEWLLSDYGLVGGNSLHLAARAGDPAFAAMVGSVYYWSLLAHPVALLGYCAVIEGSPPSQIFVDRLVDGTGMPASAFSTLRHHSDLDVHHAEEIFDLIDALPLDERHEAILGVTALQTADLLVVAADELLERVDVADTGD